MLAVRALARVRPAAAAARALSTDAHVAGLAHGIRTHQRAALARAITLVESTLPRHHRQASELIADLAGAHREDAGLRGSIRIGISGPPGAGKSTLIEALGTTLADRGIKVAVLAVDPSSTITGGSILGDKTRMTRLSNHPNAYVRPSPSCGTLGGVARFTNDAVLLCDIAGYEVVLVETVGVGQSEIRVADMVDLFLLVVPPAAGDELQGIKKGIMEVADLIVVNKADGPMLDLARHAQVEILKALKFVRRRSPCWKARVLRCSSVTHDGIDDIWDTISEYRSTMAEAGEIRNRRAHQRLKWMWSEVEDTLMRECRSDPRVAHFLERNVFKIEAGNITPRAAAARILSEFRQEPGI